MRLKVQVWSNDKGTSTTVKLSYSSKDPLAIELSAIEGSKPWCFDRELLVGGVTGATGTGDVRIEPVNENVVFHLNNGVRSAVICAPRDSIIEFLQQIYSAVPNGAEKIMIPRNVDEFEEMASDGPDHSEN
jgi:hypothetical protein